ncbi:MAG: sigma-70 family RNA polymerase sigma factor [Acidobacteriota bacterium]|nr:sigma-70 family RNA polymerase sigma factor [Blastocatellia bacterium]MDW8412563.1 sigma-70 family RNA polymerase sigma factor [Acidobacteriota bacterium]
MSEPQEVTLLLKEWTKGNREALDKLIQVLYGELRRLAEKKLRSERSDHTLQPTALVNEMYIRFANWKGVDWQNRTQFLAVAASVMRNILVDYARSHSAKKRGAGNFKVSIEELPHHPQNELDFDIQALDSALCALEKLDARQAKIVELKYFGGLTYEEVADVMKISVSTVRRELSTAKAWLFRELRNNP